MLIMNHITLVLGGTKSGKSSWAQQRAREREAQLQLPVLYIATAEGRDEGMRSRIAEHKAARPSHWITLEEPLRVSEVIREASREKSAVILDCLTLLSSNLLMELGDPPDRDEAHRAVLGEVEALLDEASQCSCEVILISNYVEAGLVAPTYLGGLFQDIAGMTHQQCAGSAREVIMMIAGIPQQLKPGGGQ